MHIVLAGPIAGEDIRHLLPDGVTVPTGYRGAPLMGILIEELLRIGHRVTGITLDAELPQGEGPAELQGDRFTFIACPSRRHAWRFNGKRPGRIINLFADERRNITAMMLRAKPDVVHAHWSYEFALSALDQPAPHLITCHDDPRQVLRYTRSPYRALRWLMAIDVFRKGRAFTTVSDYMAERLSCSIGALPTVIPNPISSLAFELGKPRLRPVTRKVAMVCNGWSTLKNPQTALRAFDLWRRTEPSAELHLYGAEFGKSEVGEKWAVDNLPDTRGLNFHGRTPHARLIEDLSCMDGVLHTSLEESFGVVIAEAMALGLPVVAGKASGAVPWVMGAKSNGHCETGVLVDVFSPTAIVNGLTTLFDENYAERSSNGISLAKSEFSATRVTSKYSDLYLAITKAPPK